MRTRLSILALMLALAATGVASAQVLSRERGIGQLNNSGQVGYMMLYPRGSRTLVRIVLLGEPAGRVEPAHIHRGECPDIDPVPAYPLNAVVNGHSLTLVNAPIDKLMSGNYSINVHASPQNIKHYVACGYLTPGS
ncbi:MAG TPA: hypothetical protein VNJ51_11045 [Candidatus Dormibacteraeota bacterium]|nr:hypothetical protein [Candidatus Dormibacteraeota bacterium]